MTEFRFFAADDFDSAAAFALSKASQGTMDVGTVFSTLSRIEDGDAASWLAEWRATAERLRGLALGAKAAGSTQTASFFFLAASDAYVRALAFVDALEDQSELLPLFRLHRACWDEFIDASHGRHVRFDVALGGSTTMPGYLLRPDSTGAARPTLVVTNGSDGSLSGLWAEGARTALDRGYNVYVFDGPGQQSLLFEQGIAFRPDWEAVLTPVVDALVQRADVRADALVASGVSQGGYWLGRALAFEHRFAAAAVDGGVVDVSRGWRARLPAPLLALLDSGDAAAFDAYFRRGFAAPQQERVFRFRARPYGGFESPFELFTAVSRFRLDDQLIGRITTPTLVFDPDDEEFFPGQPEEFYDALTAPKVLARFRREDGAGSHCQPYARNAANLRMLDFFDDQLRWAAQR
jgi:alpha-beta hydrolase superfamily lysophospholipase